MLGIGYRIVGESLDLASYAGINVRKKVLGLFVASGMAADLADSIQQPKARPKIGHKIRIHYRITGLDGIVMLDRRAALPIPEGHSFGTGASDKTGPSPRY